MTKNGVERDLKISTFVYKHKDSGLKIEMRFSSFCTLQKFYNLVDEYRVSIPASLIKKLRVNIDTPMLFILIKAYCDAEKRGFYVVIDDVVYSSLSQFKIKIYGSIEKVNDHEP